MSIKKEKLNRLENKKIALLGLGLENFSLLRFLISKKVNCEIIICDKRSKKNLEKRLSFFKNKNIKLSLCKNYDKNLDKFDIIMRSPGYPLFSKNLIKAKMAGVEISSPMKLFFEISPTKNIIGITGTKGKGTTSSLIYEIIKASKRKVYLGGNIGVAPFDFIEKIKGGDYVVLELSSFQLEDFEKSSRFAVITNFFKEHLAPADPNNPNYHKTMNSYLKAKLNLFKFQKKGDACIVNKKLKDNLKKYNLLGKKIYFSKSEFPSKLVGEHNKENVSAAIEVAEVLKIKKETIKKVVKNFSGLPHRIEFVKNIKGIKYYDDSFATTPESSIIALNSFKESIVLLAGGADKGADFKDFSKEIKKRVKFLILFSGKGTDRLRKVLKIEKKNLKVVDNMTKAVKIAESKVKEGNIVLLSTGCASFGVFRNYKERGDQFKKEVSKIK